MPTSTSWAELLTRAEHKRDQRPYLTRWGAEPGKPGQPDLLTFARQYFADNPPRLWHHREVPELGAPPGVMGSIHTPYSMIHWGASPFASTHALANAYQSMREGTKAMGHKARIAKQLDTVISFGANNALVNEKTINKLIGVMSISDGIKGQLENVALVAGKTHEIAGAIRNDVGSLTSMAKDGRMAVVNQIDSPVDLLKLAQDCQAGFELVMGQLAELGVPAGNQRHAETVAAINTVGTYAHTAAGQAGRAANGTEALARQLEEVAGVIHGAAAAAQRNTERVLAQGGGIKVRARQDRQEIENTRAGLLAAIEHLKTLLHGEAKLGAITRGYAKEAVAAAKALAYDQQTLTRRFEYEQRHNEYVAQVTGLKLDAICKHLGIELEQPAGTAQSFAELEDARRINTEPGPVATYASRIDELAAKLNEGYTSFSSGVATPTASKMAADAHAERLVGGLANVVAQAGPTEGFEGHPWLNGDGVWVIPFGASYITEARLAQIDTERQETRQAAEAKRVQDAASWVAAHPHHVQTEAEGQSIEQEQRDELRRAGWVEDMSKPFTTEEKNAMKRAMSRAEGI